MSSQLFLVFCDVPVDDLSNCGLSHFLGNVVIMVVCAGVEKALKQRGNDRKKAGMLNRWKGGHQAV